MKKIIVLLLLCFAFVFSGCNAPTIQHIYNAGGDIEEYYFIPFNSQELMECSGVDLSDKKSASFNELCADIQNTQIQINQFVKKKFEQLLNAYAIKILTLEIDDIDRVNYQKSVALVKCGQVVEGGYAYSIKFKNANIFNFFNQISQDEILRSSRNKEYNKNLFYTKVITEIQPYLDKQFNNSENQTESLQEYFYKQVIEKLKPLFNKYQHNEMEAKAISKMPMYYQYKFTVPSARYKSNANYVFDEGQGYFTHIWNIPMNNRQLPEDKRVTINTWVVVANKPVWYATIVVGTIIVTMFVYFIVKAKEKRKI